MTNKYDEIINPLINHIIDVYSHTEEYLDDEQRDTILKRLSGEFIKQVLQHSVGELKKERNGKEI